jgi:hypothetical protein
VYLLIRKRAVLRKNIACGRFMLAFWLTSGYYNIFSNKSQKKNEKKRVLVNWLIGDL